MAKKQDEEIIEAMKGCVIKLDHIPYGFFEKQLSGYFSQFGRVVRVRVPRSKAGRFKERAYVLFDDKDVARLAAEAMDNYLMFDKRVRCKVLNKSVPATIRSGPRLLRHVEVEGARKKQARQTTAHKSEKEVRESRLLARSLSKSLKKLQEAGYEYEFDFSHKIPPV